MTFRIFSLLFILASLAGAPLRAQQSVPPAATSSPSPPPVLSLAPSPAPSAAARDAFASAPGGYLEMPAPAAKLGYNSINVDGPYIAMTFDDGPHATFTPRLLEMLSQRHLKATFFLVGQCAAEFPQIVKRIGAEGHELANHSWSHPNFAKMSDEAVRSQIEKTQEAISQASGAVPTLLRPPYGSITDRQRKWINDTFHLKIILWSVDPLDWKNRNAATVARRILAEAQPGSIILSHDIHGTTVDAMPEVFDTLIARGFKFVTVSELIAMEKPIVHKPAKPPEKSGAHSEKSESATPPAKAAN